MADQHARWHLIDELFAETLEQPAAERGAYLRARARGDETLVREVEQLLDADTRAHVLLDAPTPCALPPGMRLGPYALDGILGTGGMATVYLAHRADQQFDKQVAIKLVHQWLAAALAGGRFETERRVLARLEHANIARLLDAGVSEFGQPYLVMEWVDGVTLDAWLAREQPDLDRTLDLWLELAGAVAYAHRNLIVHRDIKPSNVLVGRDGTAKLVDFGIAKLVEDGVDKGMTRTVLLTPRYASPEQLRGEPATTATDVFGLGLLLCEMATRTYPFDPDQPAHERAAAARAVEPRLPATMPADLAAILRMALRHEPERRYASAMEFAEDVRRFRRGLPVVAQPETVVYRVRKFVARHRTGVAAVAVVMIVLAGAVALVFRQVQIATAERDRANLEARKTDQINSFLQNMLGSADPSREGRDVRVVDVLDRAGDRLTRELQGQPEIEGDLRATLASTYQSLSVFDPAVANARRALELRQKAFGPDGVETARSLIALGSILDDRGNYEEAEPRLREGLSTLERLGLGDSVDAADGQHYLGALLNETDRYAEGEQAHRRAVALYRRLIPANDERMGRALNEFAVNLGYQQRFPEAESLHREALAIMRRARGADDIGISPTLHNLAGVLDTQGNYDEAEALYREALALELKNLGETHDRVTLTRTSLGNMFWMKKDYAQAESFARAGLDSGTKALPAGHPLIAYAHIVLGQTLADAGRPAEAEPHLRSALEMRKKLLPPGHWLIANTESVLGGAVAASGRYQEAEVLLLNSYQRLLKDRGAATDKTRDARRRLAELYRAWGRPMDAAKY
jgi:tetratricopeptide (TPR) repeat protein/tRNA A-37 threonylcarbamoyl transferase component Bud32